MGGKVPKSLKHAVRGGTSHPGFDSKLMNREECGPSLCSMLVKCVNKKGFPNKNAQARTLRREKESSSC